MSARVELRFMAKVHGVGPHRVHTVDPVLGTRTICGLPLAHDAQSWEPRPDPRGPKRGRERKCGSCAYMHDHALRMLDLANAKRST